MRNFVIAFIVLSATSCTAFGESKEPPKKLAVDLGDGMKMELTLIPAGEFKMGSAETADAETEFFEKTYGELGGQAGFVQWTSTPQHRVRITKPFYLGTYHVTRGQFSQFVKDTGYKTDAENAKRGVGVGS